MVKKTKKTVKNEGKPLTSIQKKQEVESTQSSSSDLKHLRYCVSGKFPCERHLFLKKDLSSDVCLIVGNVPAYLGSKMVESFISQFVQVPIIECLVQRSNSSDGNLKYGQLTVSVVFESPAGVNSALKRCEQVGPYKASDFIQIEPATVLKTSITTYKQIFSSTEQLQEAVNEFMERHDESVREAKLAAKRKFSEPDEEGWVTVTKASKKVAKAVKLKKDDVPLVGTLKQQIQSGGKKKGVDLAFYSFQARDNKVKKANELLAKFEEDKKRIAQLKTARKFKPY